MSIHSMVRGSIVFSAALAAAGCSIRHVDISSLERPARPAELDAFNDFVGSWTWTANVVEGDETGSAWSGTATWEWILDQRCLQGRITSRSGQTEFDSSGIWSWNPKTHRYAWWMFNSWGYPQAGSAKYDGAKKHWTMNYKGTGLDGSHSHGRYEMTVVDKDTLHWRMVEWADWMHLIKKVEMAGTYKRKK